MAHPKRKISKQEEIREEHYKAFLLLARLQVKHIYPQSLLMRKMYYRGQVVIDKSVAVVMHFF
jgi:hypothetical protein